MNKINVPTYITLLGSAASAVLLLICLYYIAGFSQGLDAMNVSNSIDALALLSQKVLTLTVFCAVATDILTKKTPSDR